MTTIHAVVTIITVVLTGVIAAAGLARAEFVVANCTQVGVPPSWVPGLAALKATGAAGLVLGLLGVRPLGIAAAAGLVLFFVGAVTAHVRARAFASIAFPAVYLLLATASLVTALLT